MWAAVGAAVAWAGCGAPGEGGFAEGADEATAPVSIYEDALASGWTDASTAQRNLASPSPVAGGTAAIAVTYAPSSRLAFGAPAPVTMDYLELDAHGGATTAPALSVGAGGYAAPLGPYCDGGRIVAGAWRHCRVPLRALAAAGVSSVALAEAAGLSLPTLSFDTLRLVQAQSRIYDDVLRAPWEDWSWATVGFGKGTPTPGGAPSISAAFGAWQALYFHHSGYAVTAGSNLEFDVRGSTNAPVMRVRALQSSGQWTGGVDLNTACAGGIRAGVWTHCRVPLTSLSPAGTSVTGITIQEWAGASVPAMSFALVSIASPPAASPAPTTVSVAVSPASASVAPGATQQFTATVTGTTNTAVQWSVQEGAAGGSVSSTGLYTAPSTAGTYHVVARSQADTTKQAVATVTVTAQPTVAVAISPTTASVVASATRQFTATVTGTTNTAVQWSVQEGAAGGSVSSSGLYTAPSTAGTYHVVARSQADTTKQAVATVTVTAATTIAVSVSPTSASVAAGGTQQFTATVTGTTNTAVQWTVQEGAAGGAISSTGLYTAPSTAGTYHAVARSQADTTKQAVASITVTAGGGGGVYVLPSDRSTTWKPGVTLNGGIPARTTVCATVNASTYGNGGSEASGGIQAAINACPAGQVVQLSSGTFLVNRYVIVNKGITLRGAGAGQTILKKTNGAKPWQDSAADYQPIVIVGAQRWGSPDDSTSQNLTADAAKGATSITVASAAGFAAGQIVLLDELSGARWMTDPLGRGQIWASPDWRVTWQLHNPPQGTDDPLTATTPTGGDAAAWFCRRDRPTNEIKEIASVSGNTITFTSPIHISYRASHAAQLTRYTGSNVHIRGAGVEKLTMTGGSDGALRFERAASSWARNVEVTLWLGEGVAIDHSYRVELRDSYLHDGAWPSPGGAGYAISFANASSEILVENNISMMANKVMVARCSGAGSVFGYNYVDDGFIAYSENWIEVGLNASHMVGPHHVLFEGNMGWNFDSDKTHGSSTLHTIFRNWLKGTRKPFVNGSTGHTIDDYASSGNGPRRAAGSAAYSYGMSFVGNVLGEQGKMGGWIYEANHTGGMNDRAIWLLGWDDWSPYPYDPNVVATAVRAGNWDWLQQKQTWHDGSPGAIADSMYLPSKPAFFGANRWPWVDPTTGATYTLPAKARYDAGTPNVVP
ncbi:MAG: glycosyl hydrolase family 28-related protein [Anaeromyxobacteraceae bacterium]